MALYEDLRANDVLARVAHDMKPHGPLKIDVDSRKIAMEKMIPITSPWIIIKHPEGNRCDINFNILFNYFAPDIGQPPIRCQDCWKVVVTPTTIDEVVQLIELMEDIQDQVYGCKIGRDIRPKVNKRYGAYFYNRGIEDGMKCYRLVKKQIKNKISKELAGTTMLKRGCTEMEEVYGDTDKWYIGETQQAVQDNILGFFEITDVDKGQPEFVQDHILAGWIERACADGDQTYLKYVDKPFHTQYKHYENKGE